MAPSYTSPPDLRRFQARVWEIVRQIPYGQVATYGQIAELAINSLQLDAQSARAFGARWVGGALASCPPDVPWQRVINAQGKISLGGANQARQKVLLEEEGLEFDARDRLDLNRYRWDGSEAL